MMSVDHRVFAAAAVSPVVRLSLSSERSSASGSVDDTAEGIGKREARTTGARRRRNAGGKRSTNDVRCYVCRTGGLLILCDSCSASYHPGCIGLDKEIAESMKDGWRCPICAVGDDAEDREARLVRILRRQAPVKKLWTTRLPMEPFCLEKYLADLVLGSEDPIPTSPEATVGGLEAYPLVKAARVRACENGLAYVSKRFLDGGVRRRVADCERNDFVEYATDLAYLCTNICTYSSAMTDGLERLGKQLLRRWTEIAEEEIKAISVDPHFVMSFAEGVLACKRLGMYDDPAEGLSLERDIARLEEASEEADVASLVCAGKFSSVTTGPVAPLDEGTYPPLCSNCGEDLGASRVIRWKLGRCLSCHWPVTRTVPYGDLVESLVWPSLYAEIGVPFAADMEVVTDALRVIRRLRPYRPPQDIGLNAWKLQAYLVTHVLYVLSEWGARPLSPTTLHYEYDFISEALTLCMGSIDDPELCGEVVQCLRIFEAGSEGEDASLSRRISAGTCYLLSRESSAEPGRWSRGGKSDIYADYHTTMCVLVGLVAPDFNRYPAVSGSEKHSARVQEWLTFMEDEEPCPYEQTFEIIASATEPPRAKNSRPGLKRKLSNGVLDEYNILEYTKIATERRKALALAEVKKQRSDAGSQTVEPVKEEKLVSHRSEESTSFGADNVEPKVPPATSVRRKKGPVFCAICGCSFSRLCEALRCVRCRLAVHRECLPRSQQGSVKKTKYCCPLCLICDGDDSPADLHCCLCRGPLRSGQYALTGYVFSSRGEVEHNKNFAHCPCAVQCILSEVDGIHLVHNSLDGSVEFEVLERFFDSSAGRSVGSRYQGSYSSTNECCYCNESLKPLVEACVLSCPMEGCNRTWHAGCHPPRAFLLHASEQGARAFRQHDCGARH
ncbi:signal recognition particle subunit srp68 [Perkinsus olseni]|uniref:Signal recognition particle subunit srp68 n=1 Tax=Perkinsus olseni TaxID=32597 RepID=A0A7J6RM11_PEROL|nr:signal recognition particle subunit srp68 [Perkinsus olseni]